MSSRMHTDVCDFRTCIHDGLHKTYVYGFKDKTLILDGSSIHPCVGEVVYTLHTFGAGYSWLVVLH